MRDKQKVTLYVPPNLHRKLKIQAAVDSEPMSAIAERALTFYLDHSDVVDEVESYRGQSHKVHQCPECETNLLVKEGEVVALCSQLEAVSKDDLDINHCIGDETCSEPEKHDREELVPC